MFCLFHGIVKRVELKQKLTTIKRKKRRKKKKKTQKKDISSESDTATSSEYDFEQDSEEPPKKRKQPTRKIKKMVSKKKKQIVEDLSLKSQSGSDDEMQFRKRKHIIEDSSSEKETESDDVKKKADIPEAGLPSKKAHYDFFQTHLPPQGTIALMMIARIALFVKREFPTPSFSLGFTDSSKEEIMTQQGGSTVEKGKSQESPILIEDLEDLVEHVVNIGVVAALNFAEDRTPLLQKVQPAEHFVDKFQTPARWSEVSGDLKESGVIHFLRVRFNKPCKMQWCYPLASGEFEASGKMQGLSSVTACSGSRTVTLPG
ncbi:hypothetical protein Ahy_B04g069079 [Arachis hypogaea]|uniref:Uncharacterized protein n=1 Tax=Arachis hypogaea TaxID=3818 RepID=A0A444ZBK9_ARAHY|nr:hypothetical protein Ahy_B04g069079 [Arachis hypogaea]